MLHNPSKAQVIVSTCIDLHNYSRKTTHSTATYTSPGTFDSEEKDIFNIISGACKNDLQNDTLFQNLDKKARKSSDEVKGVRHEFSDYFMPQHKKDPWQNKEKKQLQNDSN